MRLELRYAKDKNVPEAKKGAAGSVSTWTAMDADSNSQIRPWHRLN
jgi:hypothetical protein